MQPNNSNNNNNKPNHRDIESAAPTTMRCTLYTLSARARGNSLSVSAFFWSHCLWICNLFTIDYIVTLFFVCRKYICARAATAEQLCALVRKTPPRFTHYYYRHRVITTIHNQTYCVYARSNGMQYACVRIACVSLGLRPD